MMTTGFKIDLKLTEILKKQPFTVSTEVIPPRNGGSQSEILEQISKLVESGSQFLSVTKGAGGSLRGGSLPIAQLIKDHFSKMAIAHFTCRDLGPEEIENQLMDHHYFGIRNILALRGDPPQGIENWSANPKSYSFAHELILQIRHMNEGQFLPRKGYESESPDKTNFCIGAAAYPDEPTVEARIDYFVKKVQAGADYGITQMLYDIDHYSQFIDELSKKKIQIPIIPGLRILKTRKQAERMRDRFQISMPPKWLKALPIEEDSAIALDVFNEMVQEFKKVGAPGIHMFVLSDTDLTCKAIESLVSI